MPGLKPLHMQCYAGSDVDAESQRLLLLHERAPLQHVFGDIMDRVAITLRRRLEHQQLLCREGFQECQKQRKNPDLLASECKLQEKLESCFVPPCASKAGARIRQIRHRGPKFLAQGVFQNDLAIGGHRNGFHIFSASQVLQTSDPRIEFLRAAASSR